MPNTSLREAAPTVSLRDAMRSLLPRRGTLSTSAQCPMPDQEEVRACFFSSSKETTSKALA